MKKKHIKIALFFSVLMTLIIGFIACEPDTVCHQDTDILCYVTVCDTNKTKMGSWGFALPVNDTICGTHLTKDSTIDVILAVTYTNDTNFISMACGCVVYHVIDSVWTTDPAHYSAEVLNSAIPDGENNNIVITYIP